jgi:hypothetical protein
MCWYFHMTPKELDELDDDQLAAFREFIRINTPKGR